jgi:hypothetical protein
MSSERDRAGEIQQQTGRDQTERTASKGKMRKRRPLTAADPFLSLRMIQKVRRTTVSMIKGHRSYDRLVSIIPSFIRPFGLRSIETVYLRERRSAATHVRDLIGHPSF